MANALSVSRYTPPGTPDTVELAVAITGNYVTAGDALNLNPSTFLDPKGIGVLGQPLNQPATPPAVDVQNAGGYYAQLVPVAAGAALSGNKLKWFAPGGAEVAQAAYPAAITGATVTIRLPLY